MARMIFPNLAVKDLDRAVAFFTGLGFTFDERMTDESATAMIINEQALVMLLVESRFKDFTTKELVDSTRQTETILALSAESREDVDAFADKALDGRRHAGERRHGSRLHVRAELQRPRWSPVGDRLDGSGCARA